MNKKGYVLPIIVIFTMIVLLLGASILYQGGLERINTRKNLSREKAFYLAEAGAYRAYAHITQYGIDWTPEESPISLGDGEFIVTVEKNFEGLEVLSVATVNGISERVKFFFSSAGRSGSIFADGIFGASLVYIDGSSETHAYDSRDFSSQNANVGSNIKIEIPATGKIFGNAGVAEGGEIKWPFWSPNAITGDKVYDNERRTLEPVIIPEDLLNKSYTEYGASGLSGNYQVSNNNFSVTNWPRVAAISGGDYKFKNFDMDSDAQLTLNGRVRLYITGNFKLVANSQFIIAPGANVLIYLGQNSNFHIANSVKMNQNGSPANLAIYSASSDVIHLQGTGDIFINSVIYAPIGNVVVANSSKFYGGIVADKVSITGNAKVYHDVALSEEPVPDDPGVTGGGEPLLIRWTKPGWVNRLQ